MRSILYRAFYNGEMYDVFNINNLDRENDDFLIISLTKSGMYEPIVTTTNKAILMQHTGLSDKNDVKIFEDDLVKYKNKYLCTVIYNENSCSFVLKHVDDSGNVDFYRLIKGAEFEVVGNVNQT